MGQIEYTHFDHPFMNIARIYLRVSSDEHDLTRVREGSHWTRTPQPIRTCSRGATLRFNMILSP